MKIKKAKHLNISICVLLTVVMIIICYYSWSSNGDYTFVSFIGSLSLYGGFFAVLGLCINEIINDNHENK